MPNQFLDLFDKEKKISDMFRNIRR